MFKTILISFRRSALYKHKAKCSNRNGKKRIKMFSLLNDRLLPQKPFLKVQSKYDR